MLIIKPSCHLFLGDEAAEAFLKAADLYKQLREENDASNSFTEAARCFRRGTHHDRAVETFDRFVIPGLLESGRHGQAAKVRCSN